jgi:hypothetical protein
MPSVDQIPTVYSASSKGKRIGVLVVGTVVLQAVCYLVIGSLVVGRPLGAALAPPPLRETLSQNASPTPAKEASPQLPAQAASPVLDADKNDKITQTVGNLGGGIDASDKDHGVTVEQCEPTTLNVKSSR